MAKTLIGVMGPGAGATEEERRAAFELGELIAGAGWVLVTGGRRAGVMDAASRGARAAGGLVVGILPTEGGADASDAVDIAVITGLGQARNNINVLTSRVVIGCGMGAGTAAEIALALKAKRHVILLLANNETRAFFKSLGGERVSVAESPAEAFEIVKRLLMRSEAGG